MLERLISNTMFRNVSLQYQWLFRQGTRAYSKRVGVLVMAVLCGLLPACAATTTISTASKPDDAYVKAAWAYFKKKCDIEAGEKIYKTFTGVKSVLVVKPLPPATEKDLFDQFWYGDPYSSDIPGEDRGERAARRLSSQLTGPYSLGKDYAYADVGFDFTEQLSTQEGIQGYERVYPKAEYPFSMKISAPKTMSRFGILWEDISKPEDRHYWVAGSRLRIIDLTDNSVVAERMGFLIEPGFGSIAGQRRPWQTARMTRTSCPQLFTILYDDRLFILKVLQPIEGKANSK